MSSQAKNCYRTVGATGVLLVLILNASAAENIREIKFDEFSFGWDQITSGSLPLDWRWLENPANSEVRLVRGKHEFSEPSNTPLPSVRMRSVVYGDLTGDGQEEAAVDLSYETGGTANWDYLYIYTLDHGAPTLLGRMESGSRSDGGLAKITIEQGLLVLDFLDKDKAEGLCCSHGFVRVRYRWLGNRFEEAAERYYGNF